VLRKLRKPRLLGAGKDLEKTLASTARGDTNETLSTDIIKNEQKLREIFSNCFDIVFRPITVHGQTRMLLVYVDGLNDIKQLNQVVLKPTMFEGLPEGLESLNGWAKSLRNSSWLSHERKRLCNSVKSCKAY
jgi:hypothetical protein